MACGDCVSPDVSSSNQITFAWERVGVNGTPYIIIMNERARPKEPEHAYDFHNTVNRYNVHTMAAAAKFNTKVEWFVCSLLHGVDTLAFKALKEFADSNPDVWVVAIIVPIEKRLKKPQEKGIETGVKTHVVRDVLGIKTVTHAADDKPHEWVDDDAVLKGLKPLKGMEPLPGLRKPPTKPVYCVPL